MPWIEKEGRSVEEARAAAVAELGIPEDDAEIEVIREGSKGLFGFGGEPAVVRVRPKSEARDVRSAFRDRPPTAPPVGSPAGGREPDTTVSAPPKADVTPAERNVTSQAVEAASVADVEPDPAADELADGAGERHRQASEIGAEMVSGILERMGLKGEVKTRVEGNTVYVEVFGDDMGILIGRGGKTLEALQELVRAGVQRRLKARSPVVVDVESYWERRRSEGRSRRRERSPQR